MRDRVQAMMRTGRIVREGVICHELERYNELPGSRGELGATLFVEIEDPAEHGVRLTEWRDLRGRVLTGAAPPGYAPRARVIGRDAASQAGSNSWRT